MQIQTEVIISPPKRFIHVDWPELWRFRDLFLVLAWRDISVRYKQTALGAVWAVFQPVITMVIFTFIFNRVAKVESGDGTPYPIFLYVGLLLWQFYSGTITKASESMVVNANMVQKVYFPRLIVPAATAMTGLVDLAVAGLVLVAMMVFYGFAPHWQGVAVLPIILVALVLASLGVGLFLASVNVKYRDVRYALPFVIQTLMYVTPVIYPVKMLDRYPVIQKVMLWLNPISGLISNARAGILGQSALDWSALSVSCGMSVVFFALGLAYFRSTERHFADIV
jgi:lipopolysaccharide transport system permease protein